MSTDTHFTHKAWHDTSDTIGKIEYPMIGDPTAHDHPATSTCCVEGQGLADRGTFVIDPDGVIQIVEITAEGIGRNAAELLRKVKAAQYVARPPGRGLPGQVGRGRRHPRPVARPRRQDLTHSPSLAGSIGDPRRSPIEPPAASTPRRPLPPTAPRRSPSAMLDANLTAQLKSHLEKITRPVELVASLDDGAEVRRSSRELLDEIAALSDHITVRRADDDDARARRSRIERVGTDVGRRASPASRSATSSPRSCSPCSRSAATPPPPRPS